MFDLLYRDLTRFCLLDVGDCHYIVLSHLELPFNMDSKKITFAQNSLSEVCFNCWVDSRN